MTALSSPNERERRERSSRFMWFLFMLAVTFMVWTTRRTAELRARKAITQLVDHGFDPATANARTERFTRFVIPFSYVSVVLGASQV